MAGYCVYSLDWDKFQKFVNNPTEKQLLAFAKRLSEHLDGCDDELEEDALGEDDTMREWPSEPAKLSAVLKERLPRPDWYGDLSVAGKNIWSEAIWGFCCHDEPDSVGFRADNDGIYWDLLELAWKHLNVPPNEISPKVALSAFGKRPYRYTPVANLDDKDGDFYAWQPMHSMHTPDEVRKMLDEFQTIAPAIEASKGKQAIYDYDALVPVLEQLVDEGRMLFIQVDT